jgi:hypothetical protein
MVLGDSTLESLTPSVNAPRVFPNVKENPGVQEQQPGTETILILWERGNICIRIGGEDFFLSFSGIIMAIENL